MLMFTTADIPTIATAAIKNGAAPATYDRRVREGKPYSEKIRAVIGHLVMGFDLTMMSLVALLGLSGILVNDSIILVSAIDERLVARHARPLACDHGAS